MSATIEKKIWPTLLALRPLAEKLAQFDQDFADEIISTAAERAWANRHTYKGEADGLKPWLRVIIRNAAISMHRHDAVRRRAADELGYEPCSRAHEQVYEDIIASEVVRRALDRINPVYAEALRMQHEEDLGYLEISKAMDCPVGSVMSRLHRGRQALRRELDSPQISLPGM